MKKNKTILKRQILIHSSKQKVWDALADFGNVQDLSPNIAKSFLTSDVKNGVGATRHCDFTAMGASVEEKIVEWNEGRSVRIQIYEAKNLPMVRGMEALFEVMEQGDSTLLTGTFEYHMSHALGDFLNNLQMRKVNEKSWVRFIAGIKHHVETEEKVDRNTKLDLSAVSA